jgi:hypothetical protein
LLREEVHAGYRSSFSCPGLVWASGRIVTQSNEHRNALTRVANDHAPPEAAVVESQGRKPVLVFVEHQRLRFST